MLSIARFIARHPFITLAVGLVVTAIVAGTAVDLSNALDPVDLLFGLGLMLGGGLGSTLVGSIILVQRPGHRIGRLMMLMGVGLALSIGGQTIFNTIDPGGLRWGSITGPLLALAEEVFSAFVLMGGVLIVAWFPDGRTTSRLGSMAQALMLVLLGSQLVRLLNPTAFGESAIAFVLIFGAYALALMDLFMRYRRSNAVRRTQIRWVLASGAVAASLLVALLAFGDRFEWLWPLWITSTMLPVIAIGIAITRYHLYDIDRIISRTIGYGVVTAVLFGVFWSANLLLQGALNAATRSDPFVVAGSTLLVAALFNPLRVRVQSVVDRRFNRARYDAERTVAGLAGRLRDEVDVARLRQDILDVVDASVKPTAVHLWLRGAQ